MMSSSAAVEIRFACAANAHADQLAAESFANRRRCRRTASFMPMQPEALSVGTPAHSHPAVGS